MVDPMKSLDEPCRIALDSLDLAHLCQRGGQHSGTVILQLGTDIGHIEGHECSDKQMTERPQDSPKHARCRGARPICLLLRVQRRDDNAQVTSRPYEP